MFRVGKKLVVVGFFFCLVGNRVYICIIVRGGVYSDFIKKNFIKCIVMLCMFYFVVNIFC